MSSKSAKKDEQDLEDELDLEEGQNLIELLKPEDEWDEYEENRNSPRSRLVQIGELEAGGELFACFIVDLSKSGTKIRTLDPLNIEPSSVKLHIAGIGAFDAEVRWVKGTDIGLSLNQEIEAPEEQESASIEEVLRVQNAQ